MLTLRGHSGPVWTLTYSPDGRLLASGGFDRMVRLWDLQERCELLPLEGHLNAVVALAFSPNGDTLASVGNDKCIRLWDVARGRERAGPPRQTLPLTSLAFLPGGRPLATGSGLINCLAVRADGLIAVGAGYANQVGRGAVIIWDLESCTASAKLELTDMGHWFAVHPGEERRVAMGGGFRVIKLWQPAREATPVSLPSRHPIGVAAFSPQGDTLATAAGLMTTLWDTATWRERATLKGHVREVSALAFTADGTALLSGGIDRSVRLWDVASGRQRTAYGWRISKINAVAVSPDGLTAAAAGESSQIAVWDLDSA